MVAVDDARPDATTAAHGQPVSVDVLANDTCPGCTVTAVGDPTSGTAAYAGAEVSWAPPAGPALLARTVDVGYTAGDDLAADVASSLRVLTAPADLRVDRATAVPVGVLLVEAGCAGCTVTLDRAPAAGDLDPAGTGGFVYTPPAGFVGEDSFGYRVLDAVSGLSVDGEVLLSFGLVAPPPDPEPTAPAVQVTAVLPDPGARPLAGDVLALGWTVRNAGDEPLTGLVVTSPLGGLVCGAASLAVGASTTCTTDHVLRQAELDAGTLAVTASATATGTTGPASDDGPADLVCRATRPWSCRRRRPPPPCSATSSRWSTPRRTPARRRSTRSPSPSTATVPRWPATGPRPRRPWWSAAPPRTRWPPPTWRPGRGARAAA